jgi:hypothetical protein
MEGSVPAYNAAQAFLARLRDGWRARNEFAGIGQGEIGLIAAESGMTAKDLQTPVERGPDGAHLLYERMLREFAKRVWAGIHKALRGRTIAPTRWNLTL